ncbi:MAG: hypothetical protein ACRDFX_00170 [Chloroflexota bacterium]
MGLRRAYSSLYYRPMMKSSWRNAPAALVFLGGISISWSPYSSHMYPYTISQPSSFRHEMVIAASGQRVDYFFPALLGSFPTNVNISAVHGDGLVDAAQNLRQRSGRHVHRAGYLRLMGKRRKLTEANFVGLASKWTEDQVTFVARGYTWRLTASYEHRFRRLRPMMLRMLASFRLKR